MSQALSAVSDRSPIAQTRIWESNVLINVLKCNLIDLAQHERGVYNHTWLGNRKQSWGRSATKDRWWYQILWVQLLQEAAALCLLASSADPAEPAVCSRKKVLSSSSVPFSPAEMLMALKHVNVST